MADQAELDRLRRRRDSAQARLLKAVAESCPGTHRPTQHRDHRPAWCGRCGRTADGIPVADPFIRPATGQARYALETVAPHRLIEDI